MSIENIKTIIETAKEINVLDFIGIKHTLNIFLLLIPVSFLANDILFIGHVKLLFLLKI